MHSIVLYMIIITYIMHTYTNTHIVIYIYIDTHSHAQYCIIHD